FEQLDVGVDGSFKFEITHALATGLVDAPDRGLHGKRYRDRIARGALDRKITEFGKTPAQRHLIAVIEASHAANIVGRTERTEFDLIKLGGCKFVFVFGL